MVTIEVRGFGLGLVVMVVAAALRILSTCAPRPKRLPSFQHRFRTLSASSGSSIPRRWTNTPTITSALLATSQHSPISSRLLRPCTISRLAAFC